MLGILIGTACLIGLIKVARMGRYGRHGHFHGGHGCGRGCGHHGGWGRHHHGGGDWEGDDRGGGGWGRGFFLRRLFEQLDTTPGQEKAVKAALEELFETMKGARAEWTDTTDLAILLTGETFDSTAAEGLSGKADASFAKVRVAMVEALRKVHEALDDRQRKILADWLRSRGQHRGPFGGFRNASAWM